MANLNGRKFEKWQKSLKFWGERSEMNYQALSKYIIYALNVRQIHALKLVLEANGKYD